MEIHVNFVQRNLPFGQSCWTDFQQFAVVRFPYNQTIDYDPDEGALSLFLVSPKRPLPNNDQH